MKIRIKFTKFGPVKFLGHLDVMRFFQKVNRRARLDVAYSGGFSPHQIMAFANPLGVGIESFGEYYDLEVNSFTSSDDVVKRLNEVSVPGITITSCTVLPEKSENAMASVTAAAYLVRVCGFPNEKLKLSMDVNYIRELFKKFISQKEINIVKETKKGLSETNIKDRIFKSEIFIDNNISDLNQYPGLSKEALEYIEGSPFLYLYVDASSSGNLKARDVVRTFCEYMGENYDDYEFSYIRLDVFTCKTDENGKRILPDALNPDTYIPLSL